MKPLLIAGIDEIPNVILDKEDSLFEISGNSLAENVSEYYEKIFVWMDHYLADPNKNTTVNFKMNYFNTPSSKLIYMFLEKIKMLHTDGYEVEINWHAQEDDNDLIEVGEEYKELLSIPFNIVTFI